MTAEIQTNEDGYQLWLRYAPVSDVARLTEYRQLLTHVAIGSSSPTLLAAREELAFALKQLIGVPIPVVDKVAPSTSLVVGTPQHLTGIAVPELEQVGSEGYVLLRGGSDRLVIAANTDIGVLYGVFHFLRLLQMQQSLDGLRIISAPKINYRLLNHWDNLDRTIERGYAGFSLWDWHKLPDYLSPQYKDYARANASNGINGVVLTNVNANALVLTPQYLIKVAALANVFRPYGIRVYLSARFSAPIEIGGLNTTDPLDPGVIDWWQHKTDEIYSLIPDFGGFLVKANSEGQPGPRDYGRSHADGANMLAKAVVPHGGIVCWRAFIYDDKTPDDRAKQAYSELVPQDGTFSEDVLLQVKNGPIDFQPREPYHPLFGAMPRTPLMLEVQLTQEYLGLATHLVYLAPMFKGTLDADTFCQGEGSLVANVIDGSLDKHTISGIAGVSNIGSERNWCGHPFAAANWYAFGRLGWDHRLSAAAVAEEWLRLTFSNDARFVSAATTMMLDSREAVVNYMTPLGLHHIMAWDHHYGPGPWVVGGRADWSAPYYHRADSTGIGFDRTASGSNAISQYPAPFRERIANLATCPDELLLWFHHVAWDYRMKSGRTLWDTLCLKYQQGVDAVRHMQQVWNSLAEYVDPARFEHVSALLKIQEQESRWWRDACLLYFQTFAKRTFPSELEAPAESLDYYMNLTHYYVPGIRERRF